MDKGQENASQAIKDKLMKGLSLLPDEINSDARGALDKIMDTLGLDIPQFDLVRHLQIKFVQDKDK